MVAKLSSQDKRWQAEQDAQTLMRASEISDSSQRLRAALQEVKNIKKEAESVAKRAGKFVKTKKVSNRPKKRK